MKDARLKKTLAWRSGQAWGKSARFDKDCYPSPVSWGGFGGKLCKCSVEMSVRRVGRLAQYLKRRYGCADEASAMPILHDDRSGDMQLHVTAESAVVQHYKALERAGLIYMAQRVEEESWS